VKVSLLVTSLGLAALLSACSESTTSQEHVAKAKSSLVKQELAISEIELKNALKIDGKNAEARFLLGQLYLSQGNSLAAVKELERALLFKFDSNKTVPLLARAYLLAESYEDILSLQKDNNNLVIDSKIKYLTFKSIAALRIEKTELAQKIIQQLNSMSESHSYTLLANAYLNFAENKNGEALSLLEKSVLANPKNIDAFLLKGHVSFALNNFTHAVESYKQYEKFQPKVGVTKLFIANSLLRDKKYDEAEKYADAILATIIKQPFANYIKAVVRYENKDYKQAKEYAEVALNENYNLPILKLIAGASAYHLNNFESAHHHLNAIAKKMAPNHYARKMLAISQLQLGLVEDINDTLSGFNATTPEGVNFLSSLSYQLAELGALDDAKTLAKRASNNTVEADAEQNVRSGILKLMLNDPSGMRNIQNAIALDPDMLSAQLALATTAIERGDFEQALSISKEWQKKFPKESGSYNILAAVYMKKGELEKAKEALNQSLALKPNNLFALVKLINVAVQQKNIVEAKRLSVQGVVDFPENLRLLKLNYFLTKDSIEESTVSFEKIKSLFQGNKDDLNIGILYAEVLIDSKEYKASFNVLNTFPVSIKSPKRLWQLKFITQRYLKNKLQEKSVLESWHKTNPYHVEPIILLVEHYANTKQKTRALSVVNKALAEYHSESTLLKVTKIFLLLDEQRLVESKALYQELAEDGAFERAGESLSQGIEGRIFLLEKNYPKAIVSLKANYLLYPTAKNVVFLASAYQRNQDSAGAIDVLEKYLLKNESDNRIRSILASFYLKEKPKEAVLAYEQILVNEPNNITILNNLSWLYLEDDQVDRALPFAEKAYKLAPLVPNVSDTYAQVLVKLGKKREALVKSKEAFELSKGKDIDIALNYIEVLILNSRKNAAKKLIVEMAPRTNAQKSKMKELLTSL
jgi:putative PEP-CTERM system TPR-repeat lipoprotein